MENSTMTLNKLIANCTYMVISMWTLVCGFSLKLLAQNWEHTIVWIVSVHHSFLLMELRGSNLFQH